MNFSLDWVNGVAPGRLYLHKGVYLKKGKMFFIGSSIETSQVAVAIAR
jgi:hypothetical protein